MKASDFSKKFDESEDIIDLLDLKTARPPGLEMRRGNVDFPVWMVQSLDKEARRVGVTRQALIKLWLAGKLGQG
jgi:hypothetical protein